MAPDERRQALIDATTPLLIEHGLAVPTRQIAEAAGVAEGTIFRVFDSKEELIHACVAAALASDALAKELGTVPAGADLRATVKAITVVLTLRIERLRRLVSLLHERPGATPDGPRHHHDPNHPGHDERCRRPDPASIRAAVLDPVTVALAAHADALRVGPQAAASALVALTFGATHSFSGSADLADPDTITDLLLHGITREA